MRKIKEITPHYKRFYIAPYNNNGKPCILLYNMGKIALIDPKHGKNGRILWKRPEIKCQRGQVLPNKKYLYYYSTYLNMDPDIICYDILNDKEIFRVKLRPKNIHGKIFFRPNGYYGIVSHGENRYIYDFKKYYNE